MIRITVEGDNPSDLRDQLLAAANALGGDPSATTAPKAKATKAAKVEEPAEEDDGSEGITYDEISALVLRLSKEKGRDVAINFLKGFKNPATKKPATKGAEIGPADYPKAKADAEELLAEEELG